jgi:hypothetical protein
LLNPDRLLTGRETAELGRLEGLKTT